MTKIVTRVLQFKKDYKKALNMGKDMDKIHKIISLLISGQSLPLKYRDHKLAGKYSIYRECHIEPDWLLIYQALQHEIILVRTGSHSELFN